MKLKKFYLLAFSLITLVALSFSAKAQLDPSFGTSGVALLDVFNNDKPMKSFLLPDGKILVVNEGTLSGTYKYYFVRFNADGTPDTGYGTNGVNEIQLPNNLPQIPRKMVGVTRQSDGKIVLVGAGAVIRYNESGTIDTTFSGDGFHTPNVDQNASEWVVDVVQQPDGKLVAAGYTNDGSGTVEPRKIFLVRYETNGELDPSFGDQFGFIINSVTYAAFSELILQSNGKFLTVPEKEILRYNIYYEGAVQRFNSNGTIDNSFTSVYFPANKIRSFKLLNNDSFIVGENTAITDDLLRSHTDMTVSRYTSNGVLDVNFGTNGRTTFDVASSMSDETIAFAEQSDGKIIIGGGTNIEPNRSKILGLNLSLSRLNSNGTLDGKFLATSLTSYFADLSQNTLQFKGNVIVQPDGKILTVTSKAGETGNDLLLTRSMNVPLQINRFQGTPFSFLNYYYSNASIYRPSNRNWYFSPSLYPVFFGLTQDVLAPSDFLGDFRTDLAVFRPSEGNWYIAKPDGTPSQNYRIIRWGKAGDIPMPRDYDGDSKSDIAVFRPLEGAWYIRNSSDESARIEKWGMDGDKPVAGDYDGDGFNDVAVWRPSTGTWYISRSSDGQATIVNFGFAGDVPVQEDYDGDGKCDIAVWRPSTGTWYIWRSSDSNYTIYNWGLSSDIPTPSDYDGDKKTDIAIWRPSNRNWFIAYSDSNSYAQFTFGLAADIPAQGRY